MPSTEEFEAELDRLAEFTREIGDEVVEEHEEGLVVSEDGETEFTGHQCLHGEHMYLIVGHPNDQYFHIYYFLSLLRNLAGSLPPEVIEAIVSEDLTEDEARTEAASALLDDVSREEMDELQRQLFLVSASTPFATNTYTNEAGSLTDLEFEKKIFPYEEPFSLSDFNDAVQAIVTGGSRASAHIRRTLSIDVDEENPSNTQVNISL